MQATESTRIERDSMGEMAVPTAAYYGASTQRAVLNFPISDLRMPRRFIRALGQIKRAAAEVNRELGLLDAELADAVAASCAIPGFYHPVTINGRRYVDGGLWSTSNLDILRNEPLDLVICLNPTSSLHPTRAWNPAERLAAATRGLSGRRLGSEAKKLRAKGIGVVLVQPTSEDHAVMGPNLMSTRNRNPVIQTAIRTVGEQLRASGVAELLDGLAAGNPYRVRRPDGPPSTWPQDLLPGRAA